MEGEVINTGAVNDEAKTPEQLWDDFWKEIVCNPDGTVNIEQLKKELADYSFIMNEVPKVYCAVTGDTLSKPNYHAQGVIDCANEYYGNLAKQDAQNMLEFLVSEEKLNLGDITIQQIINDHY